MQPSRLEHQQWILLLTDLINIGIFLPFSIPFAPTIAQGPRPSTEIQKETRLPRGSPANCHVHAPALGICSAPSRCTERDVACIRTRELRRRGSIHE
ncbi:hypothetical protein VUR80DRAFT_3559 [Thermomyces stellatus]